MSINISSQNIIKQLNLTGSYSYSTIKEKKTFNEYKTAAKDSCSLMTTSLRRLRNLEIETQAGKSGSKKHIKNFVDSYNSLLNEAGSLSSKTLDRRIDKLEAVIDEYADDLEELGITRNSKGKLTFTQSIIDEAESSDTFKKLFEINSDFSTKFQKQIKAAKSIVNQNVIETTNVTSTTNVKVDSDRISAANSVNTLSLYINAIKGAADKNSALTYMEEIIKNFNDLFLNKTEDITETLDELSSLIKDNSNALKEFGAEADETGSFLSFSAENNDDGSVDGKTIFTDNYEKAIALFNGEFGERLDSLSKDIFCQLLETSKHNININHTV